MSYDPNTLGNTNNNTDSNQDDFCNLLSLSEIGPQISLNPFKTTIPVNMANGDNSVTLNDEGEVQFGKSKKKKKGKTLSFDNEETVLIPPTNTSTDDNQFILPTKIPTKIPQHSSGPPTQTSNQHQFPSKIPITRAQSTVQRPKLSAASMFDSTSLTGPTLQGHDALRSVNRPINALDNSSMDQPFLSFDQETLQALDKPLLDPITPAQLYKPQLDYLPVSRYDSSSHSTTAPGATLDYNRAYYSMDGTSNEFNDDIYRYGGGVKKEENPKSQQFEQQQPMGGQSTLTAAAAQRQQRKQKRNDDATGWEDERRAIALGLSVARDFDELKSNSTESTATIYPDEQIPEFLHKYHKLLVSEGSGSNSGQSKLETLSMFKQEKVQVCQKMDGHMMRLAKDGNQSIIEYRNQKDRLKNQDRFWEAKGNMIGAVSGENFIQTDEDKARLAAEREQQKNELGGYVGDSIWIQRQLELDQIVYQKEYLKEKEIMLKKLLLTTHGGAVSHVKEEAGINNGNPVIPLKGVKGETCSDPNRDKFAHFSGLPSSENTHSAQSKIPAPSTQSPKPLDPLRPTSLMVSQPQQQPTTDNPPAKTTLDPSSTLIPTAPTTIDEDPSLTPQQREQLKYLEIKNVRDNLPAFQSRHQFLQHVRDSQVVIVVGETGSGKTTQLAQYLYETGYTTIPPPPLGYKWTPEQQRLSEDDSPDDVASTGGSTRNGSNLNPTKPPMDDYTRHLIKTGHRIVVTQPRRVAATSVAARVAEEMGVELGTTVGYAIRFEECTSPYTAIKFMTDGILLRETLSSPNLSSYSVVIIDEAHERSLNSDILFGLLRTILTRRSDLKLIVTSATMNADAFSKFFSGAPIMHISGRTFPVDLNFSASVPADYILAAAKRVLQCHLQHVTKTTIPITDPVTGIVTAIDHLQPTGDILVFMTGQDDVEATCYYIRQELENAGVKMPLWVLPITSTLPQDVQSKIFLPSSIRKCIVATNIAETSLTIDGVRYVIDTGLYKLKTYNAQIGMDMLTVTPISQASANQRKGRAGRTSAGICYRLYRSEEFFNELLTNNIAEIHRTNLSNVILTLKALFNSRNGGSNNIFNFPFLEKPATTTLLSALHQLYLLGAIDDNEQITPIGQLMTLLPLDPPLSRLLIESIRLQCLSEVLTLASMLTVPNVYYRPHGKDELYQQAHAKFALGEGDFITLVNIYNAWAFHGYREQWCIDNYLQFKGLVKAREIRSQLVNLAKSKEFCEKVLLCFSTQVQRDEAMRVATERHKAWTANQNPHSRRTELNAHKRSLILDRDEIDASNRNNNDSHYTQKPAARNTQSSPHNNQQPSPTIASLYHDSLPSYHIFQQLLHNSTHILTSTTTSAQWSAIRKCICAGYFINGAKLLSGVAYQNIRTGIGCEVHGTSTLGTGHDFVIYQDIVVTTKNYMRFVSAVEPEWLVEYGHKMYKMKQSRSRLI